MENLEFKMTTDLATLPKTIDFNYDGLKAALSEGLSFYNGLVVTEDSIKSAKEDRAKLNKLREALESKRKEIKKECLAPYADFEEKVKELVGMIDRPISAIDDQLKAYEDKRRAEKRAEIEGIYAETAGDLAALLPFERVWEDSWYNVSVTIKKVREAIAAKVEKTAGDLAVLSSVESEFMEPVKLKYLETGDLAAALRERERLAEQATRLREYEDAQSVWVGAGTPPDETPDPSIFQSVPHEEAGASPDMKAPEVVTGSKYYRLCFECEVTKEQARDLAQYLKSQNITYRRV